MKLSHFNCPSCHAPIAREQFEKAFGANSDYLVCPECDYLFVTPLAFLPRDSSSPATVDRAPLAPIAEAEVECSTSD